MVLDTYYPNVTSYMTLCTNNYDTTQDRNNACVYCQKFCFTEEIEIYIDGVTAICPHCGIDSVIAISEIPGFENGNIISEIEASINNKKEILEWYGWVGFDKEPTNHIVKLWVENAEEDNL